MNLTNFGKNACLYAIGTVGLRTAAFLLIPIYTYTLAVDDYGMLAVLLQTAQIMVIVMSLGSRTALVRFAKEYEDRNRIGTLLGTSIFITIAGAAVVTVLATVLSPLFSDVLHTGNVSLYLLLTCVGAAFNCLSVHLVSYYRSGEDGIKVTVANLAGAAGLILVTMIFLRVWHLGVYGALLAQAIIYGAVTAFLFATVSSKISLSVSKKLAGKLIWFGLPLILVMGGGLIIQASALYFVSYFRGLEEVGIYSLGLKMAQIAEMVLILPFEMAYEPFVYRHIGDASLWTVISRLLTYLMLAFALVAFGIVFTARDLLPLIAPPTYGSAYLVIFLTLPALAFRGVYYIGESMLFLDKKTHIVGGIVSTFTIIGVALNALLISRWGVYGAAAVFVITTVGIGAVVMTLALKRSPVHIETGRLFITAVVLFGLLATVYVFRDAAAYVYYSVVPLSVCVWMLLLYASNFIREDERRVIHESFGRAYRLKSVLGV